MEVQQIEEEIELALKHISRLENRLKNIQKNCNHQFKYHPNFNKCKKCHKVEVFYY
ncbi:serine protease [Virgibacillus alimentarius]|uniref:Lysyl-tRNA synthetase class I n=1 Tax=Virgibacillus alimentarius TaxID=698769 RepID=A0ABS4SAJ0_9BACI|nr:MULTISPECIES: serine protease [Virgibacillus]MBP2257899.1 lysyl-tRNA synthetase class I [Virgibacillus alimentarius]HLR69486.1 serine protease [Virgibacillus sp.]